MHVEFYLFLLLVAYGVCFGLQHKVSFLHRRWKFMDEMLACTYCTGFHAGWIVFLSSLVYSEGVDWKALPALIMFSFASAAFCYVCDCLTAYLEKV